MKSTKAFVGSGILVVLLLLAMPVLHYQFGYNFRTVKKGAFYASRQMTPGALESTINEYGIHTVINLRGENLGTDWYDKEVETCKRLGIQHVSFRWSKKSLPDPESMARYVELIESGNGPFLAHCEGGTHRTGVASACFLLLEGKDTATARGQFGPMFRNAPIGGIVDLYEQSDMPFKTWVREVYPSAYPSAKVTSQAAALSPAFSIADARQ